MSGVPDLLAGSHFTEAHSTGAAFVLAGAAGRSPATASSCLSGRGVDLATSLLRRDAIKDVGGFDESLLAAPSSATWCCA